MHLRTTLLALSAALLALTACAQQVGDIDRTQPNGLEKSFFDDEWYYQRTVVDVPSGNGFTFVGSSDFSGLSKITWDVQESFLFARRSIELIEGGDDLDGLAKAADSLGQAKELSMPMRGEEIRGG